jgi:hypothetical protein
MQRRQRRRQIDKKSKKSVKVKVVGWLLKEKERRTHALIPKT